MSRVTKAPSSQLVKSGQCLILPAAILLVLACTCGGIREVLDAPATEIASPTAGIPGGGMATETITPLETAFPTPTPTPTEPEATVTPTIPPTSTPTEPPPPPGSGDWGPTESDLELFDWAIQPDWYYLILEIRNNGPDSFSGTVDVVCAGQGVFREGRDPELPMYHDIDFSESVHIQMLAVLQERYLGFFNLHLVPERYDYGIVCSISAGLHDPNVSNNGIWFAVP
jgi:hypothetical protein